MSKYGRWPGQWAAICDRCGFRYSSSLLKKEWTGLMTCPTCWESKHPQLLVRGVPDNPTPPWVRPVPTDSFVSVCGIDDSSCYAGLAKAGCMIAGNQRFTVDFLLGLSTGTP